MAAFYGKRTMRLSDYVAWGSVAKMYGIYYNVILCPYDLFP